MAFNPTDSKTYPEATDEELVAKSTGYRNDIMTGIQIEMTRRLKNSIESFNAASAKQAGEMIVLTRWIKWLTLAMLFVGCIQAGVAAWQFFNAGKCEKASNIAPLSTRQ
ncbi:MAG: hypothetical protein Q6358_12130 [Candidatus Brocadiales bacterium]|nr:hypothetical protein [Candidatus Brocadiales bacterium]